MTKFVTAVHNKCADSATRTKRHEDEPQLTTRRLRVRVKKCKDVDGGIFRTFIVNCNKFVI